MRRLAINSSDAFILVYSVDDPKSFDELEQLRQTILEEREQAYLDQVSASTSASASASASNSVSGSASASGSSASIAEESPQRAPVISSGTRLAKSSVASSGNSSVLGGGHSYSSIPSNLINSACQAANYNSQEQCQAQQQLQGVATSYRPDVSPSRHWSLASIFNHNQQLPQHHHHQYQHASSLAGSSIGSSVCSSTDNSRRSSISAAEAALRTRRTRHPPMVIVANKHDLPSEKHLVNSDDIEALVVIDWNNGFVRASAALNWNINQVFQQVLKQARQPSTLTEAIVSKRRKSLPQKLPDIS